MTFDATMIANSPEIRKMFLAAALKQESALVIKYKYDIFTPECSSLVLRSVSFIYFIRGSSNKTKERIPMLLMKRLHTMEEIVQK